MLSGKHRGWIALLSFLLMVGLLVPACTVPPGAVQTPEQEAAEAVTPSEASATEPVFGGVFTVATTAVPPTLDSMSSVAAGTRMVAVQALEPLVTFAEDYSITPMLAESWDVSEDNKTYTFHLRQGVKFHDGTDMTSEDVIASMDRYMEVSARIGDFELLESYEATDDYTVVMHLSSPSASFLYALALPMAELSIFPKEIMEGKGQGELKIPDEFIGTGPYRLVEFVPDQYVHLKRFEDYQPLPGERSGLGGAKTPYFDEIFIRFVPEQGSRVAGLEVGDYDLIERPPESEMSRFTSDPEFQIAVRKPAGGEYLLFNHAEKFTSDVKFRQAILAALDMEAIATVATNGRTELFDLYESVWPKETTWYWDDPIAKAHYNQNDPEKAKQLLQEAGYNGEEIVIVTTRDVEVHYKTMMAIADQLQDKLGMNIRMELYDYPGSQAKWAEETGWHLSCTGNTTLQLLNPNAAGAYWGSQGTHPVRVHYANPEMDAAFAALDSAPTLEDRKEALKEVHRIFWEDLPNAKLFEFYPFVALRGDIQNYTEWYCERYYGVWRQP